MMRLIKRLGFKVVTDFYQSIADETLDVNDIIDKYLELQKREMIRTTTSSTVAPKVITCKQPPCPKRQMPRRTCSSSTKT